MKIVIDAREYPTSTGRYVRKLLEYLEKIDANSARTYIALIKSADFESYQPAAKNFQKVVCDIKEFTFAEQFSLLRQIRNLKPDLVHFTMVQQPILYRGKKVTTMNDLTTIRFRNPLTHPVVYRIKWLVYSLVNKYVARTSDHILTFTQFVKDDVINYTGISDKKTTSVHLASDSITVPAEPLRDIARKGSPFLFYIGRPFPHKNLRRLIDAFHILQKDHPDLQLVLGGKKDAVYDRHLRYVKEKNIKNVVMTGFVSEGQLRWLYENCAAYCFPSLSEGFGLPPLEAMIHGAPVVSSNTSCLPEVSGDAAHYFDPLDSKDMATKIHEVLTSKKLRDSLIKKGYAQAKKFSWERTAKETLAVYKRVLEN